MFISLSSTTLLSFRSTVHRSCKTLVPPRLSWGSRPRLLVSHWSRHPLPLAPFRDYNDYLQVREPGWKSRQACCISPVVMFHHKDRTLSWRSSQSRTWSISRIGRWYLGPVEVVLYCTVFFSNFSFNWWSHNPHNQDILPPVLPQWTLCTTQPPCRGSLPKPRIPCNEAFLRFESMKKYLFWSFCRVSKKGLFLNFQGYVGRPNILVILVMKCIGRGSAVHTLNLSRALLV